MKNLTAKITQHNTNDPVLNIASIDFETDPTFNYVAPGIYQLIIENAFPDETKIFGLGLRLIDISGNTLSFIQILWDDTNEINGSSLLIKSFHLTLGNNEIIFADEILNNIELDISVYT